MLNMDAKLPYQFTAEWVALLRPYFSAVLLPVDVVVSVVIT
jgi:hypothetical protein